MEEFFSEYKKQIIILIILIIILFVLFLFNFIMNHGDTSKLVSGKGHVFTFKEIQSGKGYGEIPFINIKALGIDDINQEIITFCHNEVIVKKRRVSYEFYETEDDVLSLLIRSEMLLEDDLLAGIKYRSYQIDLKEKKVLSSEDLLNRYHISMNQLILRYDEFMHDFYQEAKKKKYVDSSCDFQCFYDAHQFEETGESYFVNEDGLYFCKDFLTDSKLNDAKFFENKILEVFIDKTI